MATLNSGASIERSQHRVDPGRTARPIIAEDGLDAAIHEPVSLHAYDPAWPAIYALEAERLHGLDQEVFHNLQHIGSTAVPGLPAKPIIDILAGVASMVIARSLAPLLCALGYTTSADYNSTLSDRQWFMRFEDGRRTHHLHVVVHESAAWHARLRFRDALRADSTLRARYVALKVALAAEHATDREAYTAAKAVFVRSVCEAA